MNSLVPDGWVLHQLSDVCEVVGGGTPERIKGEFWGGDIPWASPTEITSLKSRYISKTKESITPLGLAKSSAKLHPAGTLLMTSRASIGYVAINKVPMTTNQGFQSFRCGDDVNNEFLYQYITWIRPELEKLSAGSTFSEISSGNTKKVKVVTPPLPEQQKIAQILTSVDEVIEKTQAQIDKLKDLKTAMMQELLTKGVCDENGKRHVEFKDSPVGRIPVGWGLTSLGEVGKWKGGGTPSKANKSYWCGQIPWVSPKDMKVEYISKTQDSVNMEAILGSSTNLVDKGSLLIVVRSGILQHTLPVAIAKCDLTINQDMKALTLSSDFCALYVYHYLLANNHDVLRATLKAGNTVESIDFEAFSTYKIPSPPLKEQVEIANSVESVAINIRRKEQAMCSYKNIKKALMQDLLTGKVRVNTEQTNPTFAAG